MPAGDARPTIDLTTLTVRGFIRTTVFSLLFATQTAPPPTATPLGP